MLLSFEIKVWYLSHCAYNYILLRKSIRESGVRVKKVYRFIVILEYEHLISLLAFTCHVYSSIVFYFPRFGFARFNKESSFIREVP